VVVTAGVGTENWRRQRCHSCTWRLLCLYSKYSTSTSLSSSPTVVVNARRWHNNHWPVM